MDDQEDFQIIASLDLDPIKIKLMHEESGEGWTLKKADAIEFEYRRFLYLMKLFPQEQTAPLADVDTFWHYHILDTLKYAVDCEQVFGYFLHHFPYIGLRGPADEEAHQRVGERMRELYEQTFGEPYIRPAQPQTDERTAFSGSATATAFSGVAAQEPGAQRAAATAFSGVAVTGTVRQAFSGATAKSAFSGATHSAFSGAPANTAFSGATVKTAFSGAAVKKAFSGATVKTEPVATAAPRTAFSGVATGRAAIAFSGAGAAGRTLAVSSFYSERPVLASA